MTTCTAVATDLVSGLMSGTDVLVLVVVLVVLWRNCDAVHHLGAGVLTGHVSGHDYAYAVLARNVWKQGKHSNCKEGPPPLCGDSDPPSET